ncbi:uncharacterized protein LOC129747659 [Uranotaenia lowii]|uniref:uncharacterized protein LOC129747659 n=1 Tax=Uranotaenia lowii TaxID=190385 RepID=UPI002479313F|nr:uncharacterized protein LOC129747659 [Uranotaenia lowii]
MASSSAESIKLPDLITRWMEVQKSRAGLDDASPLKIDVIDLTLLLKSMGLKLEYLDFQPDRANMDTLTVDVKCNRSGVLARMSYDLVNGCSCPEKDEKETSFWTVQATGPKAFSKGNTNTSSNLLPEVSENCSRVSKAMLSNLLDYYRSSMKTIERGEDVVHSPLKVPSPKICVTSPGMTVSSPFATPPAEGKFMSRIGDVSIKIDPSLSPMKPKSPASQMKCEEDHTDSTKSNSPNMSEAIQNATRELSKSETDLRSTKVELFQDVPQVSVIPDDNSFANSEEMKAIITSSPNDKNFEAQLNIEQSRERDLNIIHCLQQARQQIDAALLVVKLNNACPRDLVLSPASSVVITTPQTVIRKKIFSIDKNPSLGALGRRMSLPGRPSESPKMLNTASTGKPQLGPPRKKPIGTSQLASMKTAAPVSRGDTPRPTGTQLKAAVGLRKTSSITSLTGINGATATGSVKASSGSTNIIKRTTGTGSKPLVGVRQSSNTGAKLGSGQLIKSSSSTGDKK